MPRLVVVQALLARAVHRGCLGILLVQLGVLLRDPDRLLLALGAPKLYNAVNPFDWMELISLQGKTNFFEKRVGEYAKSGVGVKEEDKQFTTEDLDF